MKINTTSYNVINTTIAAALFVLLGFSHTFGQMTYTSSTTTLTNTANVYTYTTNNEVIGVQIVIGGTGAALTATSFTFNTTGTTNPSTDILNAKVWYTGTTGTFAATTPFGSTTASPNGTFSITGNQTLSLGTNYFWLTYDVPFSATISDVIDAQCTSLTVGSAYTPAVTAPAGSRTIVACGSTYIESQSSNYASSSAYAGSYANLTDNNFGTGGATATGAGNWIEATFNCPQIVTAVSVGGGNISGFGTIDTYLNGAVIQSSADGFSWATQATVSGVTSASALFTFTLSNAVTAQYWRLYMAANTWLATTELHFTTTSPCNEPTTQATIGAYTNNNTGTSLTANWTRGSGSAVIVVARLTSTAAVSPASGTTYTQASAFGSATSGLDSTGAGNYIVYNGTGTSANITGLTGPANYTFTVYEYNSTGSCYLTPGSSSAVSTYCVEPSTQATIGSYTNNTGNSLTVNWTRGNGAAGVIVVGRLTSTTEFDPAGGTIYTASSAFGTDSTGSGNYVVYIGNGTSVNVTGLAGGANYTFTVYEYNAGPCYAIPGSSANVFAPIFYCTTGLYPSGTACGETGGYIAKLVVSDLYQTETSCLSIAGAAVVDTATIVHFTQGLTYKDTVGGGANQVWNSGFWIDFNDDGNFGDAGDFVGACTTCNQQNTYGTITIPSNAPVGNHRMRVRMAWDAAMSLSTSCTNETYGEAFDYTANIEMLCQVPTGVIVDSITSNSASVSFICTACSGLYIVEYGLAGFTPGTGATAGTGGTIVTGSSSPVTLTGLAANTSYDIYVRQNCSFGAPYSSNKTKANFSTPCAALAIPWVQGFESIPTPGAGKVPACWSTYPVSSPTWTSATSGSGGGTVTPLTGDHLMQSDFGDVDWMFTPSFPLTAGTYYQFSYWYQPTSALTGHNLKASYGASASVAAMTTTLGKITNPVNYGTWKQATYAFTPASTGFYYIGIEDSASGVPWNLCVDSVTLSVAAPCAAPVNVVIDSITYTTASVSFTCTACGGNYIVEYGLAGFTPGAGSAAGTGGTIVTGSSSPILLTGLTPNTSYDIYVRQSCSSGTPYSANAPVSNFSTPVVILPVAAFQSSDTVFCANNCITFTNLSTNATSWSWTFPGGTPSSSAAQNPASVCFHSAGVDTIKLVVSNIGGKDSSMITFTVYAVPVITESPSAPSLCIGDSVQLTAGGGSTYIWMPAAALSADTGANVIATPVSPITYTVTGTDANGCSNTKSVTVNVSPVPVATAGPDTTICSGNSVRLHSSGGSFYQWTPTTGLSNSTVSSPLANTDTTVTYTVTVSNGNCSATATAEITVLSSPPLPVITQSASGDTLLCSFHASYISYQWYDDSTLIANATNSFYIVTHSGNYYVEVANANDCSVAAAEVNIIFTGIPSSAVYNTLFSLSPNPAGDLLTITAIGQSQNATITIFNMLGEKMFTTTNPSFGGLEEKIKSTNAVTLHVQPLPSGIYFVQWTGESNSWVGRFVKQ